jgi:hypothetical protein
MHTDPSLWIKNPNNFGENFEPNKWEIHLLVVVPKQKTSTLYIPLMFQTIKGIIKLVELLLNEETVRGSPTNDPFLPEPPFSRLKIQVK